jgi:hypothetical protein
LPIISGDISHINKEDKASFTWCSVFNEYFFTGIFFELLSWQLKKLPFRFINSDGKEQDKACDKDHCYCLPGFDYRLFYT